MRSPEEDGDRLRLKLSIKSLLLRLKEPPVPSILQQVVDQCYARWRFRGRRHFPDEWPSRSSDLNPCDFWLWGFLRDRVYRGRIRTLSDLKTSGVISKRSCY
ncbi:hypothetical protein TNCV_396551 [Trichonephila clavipes]|nr:hypothetical protein TNCV_396551 [Trichonephila clavipes]